MQLVFYFKMTFNHFLANICLHQLKDDIKTSVEVFC